MSIGGLFLIVSFVLFVLPVIGIRGLPMNENLAHACLVLGILLGGYPLGPWPWDRRL